MGWTMVWKKWMRYTVAWRKLMRLTMVWKKKDGIWSLKLTMYHEWRWGWMIMSWCDANQQQNTNDIMTNQCENRNKNHINTGVYFKFIHYMADLLGWGGVTWVTFALFLNILFFTKNCLALSEVFKLLYKFNNCLHSTSCPFCWGKTDF